jgi:predicted SAM-dependent methyltransferase
VPDQLVGNNLVKVNLGSGFLGLPGWLNYDNSPVMLVARFPRLLRLGVRVGILSPKWLGVKWPPIIRHDCRKGIPLAADSVDFVFTSHFLEHLYRHQVLAVLKECLRVLKPGARIRVVVPDVRKAVGIYLSGKPDPECPCTPDEVLPFTMADWLSAQFGCADMNRVSKPRLSDKLVNLRRHRWMYDRESMSRLLEHAGFVAIEEKKPFESALPDIDKLDVHPRISLYLEAQKPAAVK